MSQSKYTAGHIAQLIHSDAVLRNSDWPIVFLLTDSRRIREAAASIFFALKGHVDGHDFIPRLYAEGLRNFVVSREWKGDLLNFSEANFMKVESPLAALQLLARTHREQFSYPVIGITGSNGKTVVKEWLFHLLSPGRHIVRSPKSYNSQIGVALSVWQMNAQYDMALFEAGISQPGEMSKLAAIIQPEIGILTNIGSTHDKGFENRAEKLKEKMRLFEYSKVLISSADLLDSHHVANTTFTWSFRKDANLRVLTVDCHLFNSTITAKYRGEKIDILIPFTDRASIENAVTCWCTLLYLGYEQEEIRRRMLILPPVAMRLELKQAKNNCSLVNDVYSFDFPSLEIALDFLSQQQQHQKKTVILSDMLQSGLPEGELYGELSRLLQTKNVNRLIGIGEAISRQAGVFHMEKQFFTDTAAFVESFDNFHFQNEGILLKGARSFEFERIGKLFDRKVHDTVLEINLNSVVHNFNYYKSLLKPGIRTMAMVKAFSYGSGSFEIASILQYHRVDYLAVAYSDEGVSLRNSGVDTPILVMNPEVSAFATLLKYQLEPEMYSMRILKEFASFLMAERVRSYPVQLKLDTGMHRLGFAPGETSQLIAFLSEHPEIVVKAIFTHLVASEDEQEDEFTRTQIERFRSVSDDILAAIGYPAIRHMSNTAAIRRFPEAQFDMVRLGIGLYGLDTGVETNQLESVVTLKTSISQIHSLQAGETVGYSRSGVLKRDSRIATVKIGYADGFRRALGNGLAYMLVKGKPAAVVGNVCMDMTMIDVTDIDCVETDEVIVFNEILRPQHLATLLKTNVYEVVTTISPRVKRVYFYE